MRHELSHRLRSVDQQGHDRLHRPPWRWPDGVAHLRTQPPLIITEGEARIRLGEKTVIIHKDEALVVEGRIPHSCWNNTDGVTKMIGITVQ